jgi:hypothetical protein
LRSAISFARDTLTHALDQLVCMTRRDRKKPSDLSFARHENSGLCIPEVSPERAVPTP